MKNRFAHVVNFWLKKDITAEEIKVFEAGVASLCSISTVQFSHLGKPAHTNRPVIDRSYNYCLICVFEDQAGHDAYQVDPVHDRFRETCSHLWEKVLIYDSVSWQ